MGHLSDCAPVTPDPFVRPIRKQEVIFSPCYSRSLRWLSIGAKGIFVSEPNVEVSRKPYHHLFWGLQEGSRSYDLRANILTNTRQRATRGADITLATSLSHKLSLSCEILHHGANMIPKSCFLCSYSVCDWAGHVAQNSQGTLFFICWQRGNASLTKRTCAHLPM